MSESTKIQWADHTINFWRGCKKVSAGCKYCYMFRDQTIYGADPELVQLVSEATNNKKLKLAEPGDKIFTCSWSDFFIEEADQWRDEAWKTIKSRPDLIWLILTKRPENIQDRLPSDWGRGYRNVWLGVSVEDDSQRYRVKTLLDIPCHTRFISFEPLLSNITLEPSFEEIDWVIIGGESGNESGKYQYRPMKASWVYQLIDFYKEKKIPIFIKQLGTYASQRMNMKDRHGGDIDEFPIMLKIREFPKA